MLGEIQSSDGALTVSEGHDVTVKASAFLFGLLVVALSASCTSGSEAAASTTSSAPLIAANEATISGTLTSATGPTQTSPQVLTGCVQVTPVTSLGPAACSVSVGPDGTWSLVVKPGVYDVFGLSPASSDTRAACTPEEHNPVRVRAGDHVFVRIVCVS